MKPSKQDTNKHQQPTKHGKPNTSTQPGRQNNPEKDRQASPRHNQNNPKDYNDRDNF